MPERDDSSVQAHYKAGLALARGGRFFEAHEELETAWRSCAPEERDFFQGLVHVVVSAYQHGRGRHRAGELQRVKALRRLAPFAPRHRGLDMTSLLAALERSEPDVREQLVETVAQPEVLVEEEQQPEDDQRRA